MEPHHLFHMHSRVASEVTDQLPINPLDTAAQVVTDRRHL